MKTVSDYITRTLIRHRLVLFGIAAVIAILSTIPASRLSLDRSIDTMFAENDPLLASYHKLKRTFGGNDVVLCVYDDPELLNEDRSGLKRLTKIGRKLAKAPGVHGILSLDLPIGYNVVDAENEVSQDIRDLFEGYTHGADGRTVSVACMLAPLESAGATRAETVAALREAMQQLPDGLKAGIVTGEPVMLADAFQFIEQDGNRLFTATTILLAIIIFVSFRSLRWVAIPILVVQFALLLTNGLLGISGVRLTMVSSMLTAVVTVIGVATVVHVIVRFREGREEGLTSKEALTQAGQLLAGPIFWACVTDAVGFAALMAADVAPVRDFGLMMAIGAIMVLVSAAMIIPMLALTGKGNNKPATLWGEKTLDQQLQRLVTAAQDRPRLVAGSLIALLAVSLLGVAQLEIETDFTRNFRKDTEIVTSYELVESKLGGAGVCDVVVKAPQPLNWSFLSRMLKLEEMLRSEVVITDEQGNQSPGLTKVLSLADAVVGGSPLDLASMPRFRREIVMRAEMRMMKSRIPSFYDALYGEDSANPGDHYFRIMLRANERQPAKQKLEIIRQINELCQLQASEKNGAEAEVSGYFVLLTNLINGMLRDQWRTFAVAMTGIAMVMFIAIRDFRLALVALIPNAIPILLVNGLIGWMGLRINMGAAMIAAVSLGLSIDSSIHYLYAYRRARSRGRSQRESLEEVQQSVGRALVFSTVSLIVGFSVLATSQFVPTVYFGVLISLTMLGGLIGNLLWLPMLIRMAERSDAEFPASEEVIVDKESLAS